MFEQYIFFKKKPLPHNVTGMFTLKEVQYLKNKWYDIALFLAMPTIFELCFL